MKFDLTSKILLILIVALVVIGIFSFRSLKNDLTIETEAHQELIGNVKKEKRLIIDSLNLITADTIKILKTDIQKLTDYSNKLILKIRNYEKRPDYDIDFITAVDIIARSGYKRENDSVVKGKND